MASIELTDAYKLHLMIKNKLIILSSVTITVIVAATVFANLRAPQSQKEKTLFFPELAKEIESVNYISI